MEEPRIKAVPLNGTWESVYQKVKAKKGRPVEIKLELTDDLLNHVSRQNYDGIVKAKSKGYLAVSASLDKEGNVRLSCCIERDYGDEDGFGVEPDVYLCGTVGEDGCFIKPLYVE